MTWEDGKFCLSRRVLAGRFVLKIEKDLTAHMDGKILGGPWKTLEEAQRRAERIAEDVLRTALESLLLSPSQNSGRT